MVHSYLSNMTIFLWNGRSIFKQQNQIYQFSISIFQDWHCIECKDQMLPIRWNEDLFYLHFFFTIDDPIGKSSCRILNILEVTRKGEIKPCDKKWRKMYDNCRALISHFLSVAHSSLSVYLHFSVILFHSFFILFAKETTYWWYVPVYEKQLFSEQLTAANIWLVERTLNYSFLSNFMSTIWISSLTNE